MKDITKMTAAEFKRFAMNKAVHQRATQQVALRTTLGSGLAPVSMADKKRVREDWRNRDPNPGMFHNAAHVHAPELRSKANQRHAVFSY